MTSKFLFKFSVDFIPHIVEMMHLGGRLRTNCKCLATVSSMLVMFGILVSFVAPSRMGLEQIMFISKRLQTATICFKLNLFSPSMYSYHGSVSASCIRTPTGA